MELEPHILALLGAATAAAGVGLVVLSASAATSRTSQGTSDSLLAPTLAVDTLDPDLRVAYMRTLVLDARIQTRDAVQPSALGREFRRALVATQARRHKGDPDDASHDLLSLINTTCDEVESAPGDAGARARRLQQAHQLREWIESH